MKFRMSQSGERGYVLLALLLFVALLSIGIMTSIERIDFQIKRDREEEMIHRGVQYSRAIRRYFKKFGRYPTRIEDLENTNNMRFLRRRYKDPLDRDPKTGKERDFKLLHLQDVQMSFSGAAPIGRSVQELAAQQQGGAPGALNGSQAPFGNGPSAIAGPAGQQGEQTSGEESGDQNASGDSGQDSQGGTPPPPQPLSQQAGPNGAPQVFGGGAIVGVASMSKKKTIRVFNKKDRYNQWQFIYDPTTDRGGLLMTPNQPPLLGAATGNQQNTNGLNGVKNGINNGSGQQITPVMPPDQFSNQR